MEGICITHSCIPLYTVYMQHTMAQMQEWVIQIPSIPILVSVLFPSLHLKYFRIKFLLLVCFMRMRTKPHPHPVIKKLSHTHIVVEERPCSVFFGLYLSCRLLKF